MLLRQMEYLQAVIENGNFYLAAEQCHVSQSAISQQIKKLEDELGVKLLERHNRTFSLTPAGEHFYRKSLIISGDLKHLIRETKKIANNDHAVLRIGYYKGYHGNELSEAITLFSEKSPAVDVEITVGSHEELYHASRSGCIAPSPEQVQRDTAAADSDSDTIWIGCERSTRKNTVVRSCICALSWEALAYLALNKKIVLDLTPCGQCENDLCAEQLRKELTRLVDFFGQPMFEARFSLAYEEKEYPYHVQELTRREMLEQVSHGSKSGTKKLLQMLPGLRSEEDSGVDFRLLLHQRTKQLKAAMETPLQYGYYMPKFTDNCFGCGRCEKACRANAMKFEDMPNGQTRIVLTPWKCSECGVCMNVCSNKGFDGMKLYQLTTLGPVVLHKCTKTLCKQCGKPIAPDSAEGLCSVCRIKARTQKRQEEARQRAEQLKAERAAKAAEEAAKAAENAAGTAAEAAPTVETAAAQTVETAAPLPETIPAGQSAAPANVAAPALGEPRSE